VAAACGVVVGFLLYSAFCLSTARLLVETPPKRTSQSEQRQDTEMAADLLRTGWGKALLVVAGMIVVAPLPSSWAVIS
jgi:hypothetical protein